VVVAAAPAVNVVPSMPPAAAPAPASNQKTGVNTTSATVVIKAPTDATVLVDGQATQRSAAEEAFTTPALEPGRPYQYVFEARAVRDGKSVTRTAKIVVEAGKQSEVDFTDLGAVNAAAATVTIVSPADAMVYVDNVATTLTGAQRTFDTPKLQPGRQYYYTVKAEVVRDGRTRTETQRVVVEAGKHTTVQFKDVPAVQAASR
jgi:uncharacterized protein (TIGR03000 family)